MATNYQTTASITGEYKQFPEGMTYGSTSSALTLIGEYATKLIGSPVNVTADVTLSPTTHSGKWITLNKAAGIAITPPSATGTGNVYCFYVGTTVTSNNITFTAQGSDKIVGHSLQVGATGAITAFLASGSGTTISLNGSTKGGIKGDTIEVRDVATNVWSVRVTSSITGTAATPFS